MRFSSDDIVEFRLCIEGDPIPRPEPQGGGRRRWHTPLYKNWKNHCNATALIWYLKNKGHLELPHRGPVSMAFLFMLPRPGNNTDDEHIIDPDLDNLIKGVKDGLKKVLFTDDNQVNKYFGDPEKVFACSSDKTGVTVLVRLHNPKHL